MRKPSSLEQQESENGVSSAPDSTRAGSAKLARQDDQALQSFDSTVQKLESFGKQLSEDASPETVNGLDSQRQSSDIQEDSSTASPRVSASDQADDRLIHETRSQIRNLVQEISDLAQSDCELEDFLSGFLNRVASALGSVGAALWLKQDDGHLQFSYGINVPEAIRGEETSTQQHHALLGKLYDRGEPALVPPGSGTSQEDQAGNPTEQLLVVAPIAIEQDKIGLVEIFQRTGTGPTTQRGYVRFLVQMCGIAADYFKNQRLRAMHDQHQLWGKLESLIRGLHRSLDRRETAYTLANEGRRVLGCERVSVALARGNRCRVEVVSGLDSLDRRASNLKHLSKLATLVSRTGEPLWFHGNSDDLPPQVDSILHSYLDHSHTKWLGVIPLTTPPSESNSDETGELLGALIVEQIGDVSQSNSLQKQSLIIAQHASDAFANIKRIESIPFSAIWRTLGRFKWLTEWKAIPLSIGIPCLLIAAVVALCVVPYDFEVGSEGTLTPSTRQVVFAPLDGTLTKLHLTGDPNQPIESGMILAELENRELDTMITDLEGKELELRARYGTIERMITEQINELSDKDRIQLNGDLTATEQEFYRVQRQLAEKRAQREELSIRAPITGLIGDWQVKERLNHRPVQRGQSLMTVVDPSGAWEVELEVPEDNVGHLMAALNDENISPEVTFQLISDPGKSFQGEIKKVHTIAEVREGEQNVVLVTVAFDKTQIASELLRHGTRVRARIDCGKRPVGYVLFHDVIEAAQSRILFWL